MHLELLVFPKYKAVIFVHGCFWHRHGCKYSTTPSTRKEFWIKKFEANKLRDKKNNKSLVNKGWRVLIVWECKIKGLDDVTLSGLGMYVAKWLKSAELYREIADNFAA